MSNFSLEYEAVGCEREQLVEISKFLKSVWAGDKKLSPEYLQWLYAENPDGPIIGYNARLPTGELVGHYVVAPAKIRTSVNDKTTILTSALCLNTAVGEKARGQGLFTKLAELTFDLCRKNGIECIFGVANDQSTPGFIRKLGFIKKQSLPITMHFGLRSKQEQQSGSNNFYGNYAERQWGCKGLNWRLKNPCREYTYDAKNQRLFTRANSFCDVLVKSSVSKEIDLLAGSTLNHPRDRPTLYFGEANSPVKSFLSFAIPDRFKPVPLNVIFKPLVEMSMLDDHAPLLLEPLDFDLF